MASLINQLANKMMPSLRIIATSIKTPLLLDPVLHATKPEFINNSVPLCDSTAFENNPIPPNPTRTPQFYYPNFPFGYYLNPFSMNVSYELKAIVGDSTGNDTDDARTVWADSVKKKRKKKMNKHKYKKLRKRLRRKA